MNVIGKRLREARDRKDLKQTDVKRMTGINNKTLSGYEKGVSEPDSETLKILSDLYEVSIDWIMGNERSTKEQARNKVMESYSRLSHEKKKLIDDMIKALEGE